MLIVEDEPDEVPPELAAMLDIPIVLQMQCLLQGTTMPSRFLSSSLILKPFCDMVCCPEQILYNVGGHHPRYDQRAAARPAGYGSAGHCW